MKQLEVTRIHRLV